MLELRVLTGLHRGAALPLEGDTIRIGSAAENDIVLLDPGMPALACAIYRPRSSSWLYRIYSAACSDDEATANGTPLTAGARWFAGPVLIGCESEGSPWPAEAAPIDPHGRYGKGLPRFRTKLAAAAGVAIASTAAVALLAIPGEPPASTGAPQVVPPAATSPDQASGTVRIARGALYPNEAVRRAPFSIRSASTGPYGFVVTDDDHILVPGSRWRAFTLVRIDANRAIFTGPYRAELTW
ncbi:FHA domain-containing protein [Trinickia sp. NRRL B-1857]